MPREGGCDGGLHRESRAWPRTAPGCTNRAGADTWLAVGDGGVALPEVLGKARLRMPVPGSTRFYSVRGSAVNSSRALGSAEFCRPRYHAGIATREDIGEVGASKTGNELAASELV